MSLQVDSFVLPKDQYFSLKMLVRKANQAYLPQLRAVSRYSCLLGRNAIFLSLRALNIPRGAHILVPAYICYAAVEPILAYGAVVDFYRVGQDCMPDFSDIERKITEETKAVLAVHYFGFPQKIQMFRVLCDRSNLALIEDCAHVLQGVADGRSMGTVGEASIFSWRKFLPVYEGADLVVNRPGTDLGISWRREHPIANLKVALRMLDERFHQVRQPLARFMDAWLHAAKASMSANVTSKEEKPALVDVNGTYFDPGIVDVPMSQISRWLLFHSDIALITEARRSNYQYLLNKLSPLERVDLLYPNLSANVCPWVFPLILKGIPEAHLELRRRGIPAVTWGGVRPPEIRNSEFPEADFLYENLVFLPVHQCLQPADLRAIVDTIRELLQRRSIR